MQVQVQEDEAVARLLEVGHSNPSALILAWRVKGSPMQELKLAGDV